MKPKFAILLSVLIMLACQVIPTPPALKSTPRRSLTIIPTNGMSPSFPASEVVTISPPDRTLSPPTPSSPGELPTFPNFSLRPATLSFPQSFQSDSQLAKTGIDLPIPINLIANRGVTAGLTERQRSLLSKQGFIILRTQEPQFAEIREKVSLRYGQPYYLTTDAAYHALNQALDETQAMLEREELLRRMLVVTQQTLNQVLSYQELVQDEDLLEEVRQAAAYLGVALRLFDPLSTLPAEIEPLVQSQVNQILQGKDNEQSILFPNFFDDYSTYQPLGHYAGDPALEAYFRGMTWYGRVYFPIQNSDPNNPPSRVPLILTLALRQAVLNPEIGAQNSLQVSAAQEWARVEAILDYLTGPRSNSGPPEYATLMDQSFGRNATVLALADKSLWELFRAFAIELPASPGTSALAGSLQDTNDGQGWRFMGQRSSLDSLILGNLLYPRVGTIEKQRLLPSGLDIMAVINSPAAQQSLEAKGDLAYQNFPEQLKKLQEIFQMLPVESWVGQVYSSWLYAYQPQLQRNLPTSPSYMQSSNWTFKDLNSTLGSWADLKRDAAVKIDHPQATPIADSPTSDPVPAYVEPDPDVFYRLGDIASTTAEGLTQLGMKGVISADPTRLSLNHSIANLLDLGDRLVRLGDIASKELQGTPLSQSDLALIQAPLGPEESRLWLQRQQANYDLQEPLGLRPIRMIAETKGNDSNVLQVGLGLVDRLYVIVPIEGKPYIAQGGVFSYYEFPQPRSEQINEQEWQILLDTGPPSEPLLSNNLYLPDGNPVNVLSFRVNDSYQVTPQSIQLILLESPKNQSKVIMRLKPGELVKIVDGPVQADGYTWWKFLVNGNSDQGIEGWATENQESFQRVWNN